MIKSLSSLRFIFAMLVFLLHLQLYDVAVGHAFFIILSGFIMCMVYEERLLKKTLPFKQFIVKRIARIYPLHIITLLMAVPLSLAGIIDKTINWFGKFFINFFFLQTLFPSIKVYFSFNSVSWNAADLMLFYICFPFLIMLFAGINIKVLTKLMILLVLIICIGMYSIPENHHHYIFYISPYLRIFDFIFGIYLYKLISRLQNTNSYTLSSVLEVVAVLFFTVLFMLANYYSEILTPYIYSVYLWVPVGLVISVFYYEKGIISKKVLSNKVIVILGGLSYSFYMIHQLVIRYMTLLYENYLLIDKNMYFYISCFAISIGLSYISSTYIEKIFSRKIVSNFT